MGNILHSIHVIYFVENMWKILWETLWESCGKVLHRITIFVFYTQKWAKVTVFHDFVEKFYYTIYTHNYRGKSEFYTVSTAPTITTINYLYRDF